MFARGRVAGEVSDRAWLQAMLDFEAALARATAPENAAEAIAAACVADGFDVAEIGRTTADKGTPVPGLLAALRARLPDEAAAHVHLGATSQDVVDSAAMLVARRALVPLLEDLAAAADACASLAERFRDAPMAGRTLLQQALPTTFGLKAAGWMSGLDDVHLQLAGVRSGGLALSLGGAVGTLASLGADGPAVVRKVARSLELAEPPLPWHTVRTRPARLGCALGEAAGVMGKVALDVELLAQTEVAEVAEGGGEGRGGSSTLPHKRNPVGAVAVSACCARVPGLVSTLLAAMPQEHERAAGAWQAESETLSDLLRLTGSAAAALRELLEGLEPDPERMRANLDLTGGLLMTESVVTALTPSLGRTKAQELVEGAARDALDGGRPVRDVLASLAEVKDSIGADGLDAALAPESYLGAAGALVDRALEAHRG
ncbi:MAG TPA: lyase family protein [Thermoleophilaceae bacterium]